MTLIEGREAFEAPILGKRAEVRDPNPFDDSGSDDEYSIANEGYGDPGENNNNRDFFSLPTLGLNYLNNLHLNLNLNLNLRNTSLWRIYENSPFPKSGFLSHYLGKHGEEGLELNHDIHSDNRAYSALANFLRQTFPSNEEDYSEEAILERIRFKELQRQAESNRREGNIQNQNNFISSEFELSEKENSNPRLIASTDNYIDKRIDADSGSEGEQQEVIQEKEVLAEEECEESNQQEMMQHAGTPIINPFYNRVEVSLFEYIKMIIFTPLLIVKVALILPCLLLAYLLSIIGMYGVTIDESQARPLSGWRRVIRWIIANVVMKTFVFCTGFFWSLKQKGRIASPQEAPILVVGPHSSFFDAFVVILMGAPSVVAKLSTKDIPIFGRLVTYTQAVYVSRESKGSRKQTTEALKERAHGVHNGSGMPQIFIYPEGTCSNRSSLIKFKPGAFIPGVPVQPVVIRYPNSFDCVTWTFDGVGVWSNVWYSLAQIYNRVEIEYLPVYNPNEKEKKDPGLFAENVRRVMAEALDVPTSNLQFEDGHLMTKMRESNLVQKFRGIYRAKKALGMVAPSASSYESAAILQNSLKRNQFLMTFQQFQREFFNVTSAETTIPEVQTAFNYFKKESEAELIDVRPYLVLTCILYEDRAIRMEDMSKRLCELYEIPAAETTDENLKRILAYVFEVTDTDAPLPPASHTASAEALPLQTNGISELLKRRISLYLDFAKLFADEVADRLPKTYPSREQRDKPSRKKHLD